MKTLRTICFVAVVLFLCAYPVFGTIHFNDGLTHDIDYEIYEHVRVDHLAPGRETTINLLSGGSINNQNLFGYENSTINVHGGSITDYLISYGFCYVNISGNSIINGLFCRGSSTVNMSDGSITHRLTCEHSSEVYISGGSIGGNLIPYDQSTITIFGSDFKVDGLPVVNPELTSIFGGNWWDEDSRRLTGTLLSGELIGNDFRIGNDAKIVLIPEPATIFLLGLGRLALKRRRNC